MKRSGGFNQREVKQDACLGKIQTISPSSQGKIVGELTSDVGIVMKFMSREHMYNL